jgi:hypothetical protein
MFRECKSSCPLQLECLSVNKRVREIHESVQQTEKGFRQALSLGGSVLSESRAVGNPETDETIVELIDGLLDDLPSVKANSERVSKLNRDLWKVDLVAKLGVMTCVGTIKGQCSSPVGLSFRHMP